MMKVFAELGYIEKSHGGLVYMTELGLKQASVYERCHKNVKEKLFIDAGLDTAADAAICAFLAEISDEMIEALSR